jgi:hypothetical protein
MRQLASIQKIVAINPIEGADKIEVAQVLGWQCVIAKKDNFKVGDLVVYFEVDSILPEKPEFEFLRERKFRIKTIRLRKQISQGLVMPLSILSPGNYKEGDDVTSIVGVRKYDPEGDVEQKLAEERAKSSKNRVIKFLAQFSWFRRVLSFFPPKKMGFPKFIKKTDEERIQLFPGICQKEMGTSFILTEKLDGQSGTYFLVRNKPRFLWFGQDYVFGVCSRNLYLPKPDNSSYWTIAHKYNLRSVLFNLIGNHDFVAIQGEIVGEGIQGNKYQIGGHDFYAFNLIYPQGRINSVDAANTLAQFGLKFVPILDVNFRLKPTVQENVDIARGISLLKNVPREGVVVRNYDKDISFKIINPDFLLKYDL